MPSENVSEYRSHKAADTLYRGCYLQTFTKGQKKIKLTWKKAETKKKKRFQMIDCRTSGDEDRMKAKNCTTSFKDMTILQILETNQASSLITEMPTEYVSVYQTHKLTYTV